MRFTPVEHRIDAAAHRLIARLPDRRGWALLVEFLVFGAKQAWACLFGALLLAAILAARAWYPDDASLARNDLLTLVAVAIQVGMLAARLETVRELRVILLFHAVGTVMELFKTDVGSWSYDPGGVLRLGAVPLFTGFMYAAVGSYMVRVLRLFDLRFERYPRRWMTAVVAAGIYINFFTHHYIVDLRWIFFAAILVLYWPSWLEARVLRARLRLPVLATFVLVAFFIWIAENIATYGGAWIYPDQAEGWQPVSLAKLGSWLLLMMISVVLVTWVYPPSPPGRGPRPVGRPISTTVVAVSAAPRSSAPSNDASFDDVWEELRWRGLVHVSTDPAGLKALLAGPPITFYCGFDPTAPSLHLGNLVQLLTMRRIQLAGHRPLGLVGGSTGLIGDPRPSAERTLNTKETVAEWVGFLRGQIERFLSFEGDAAFRFENKARIVNNLDWTAPLSAIDFLRDIGKHFRVGTMLKKDAVAARLNSDAGISYTEFSYQILQGMDYLELYRTYGCVLQTGGSDQWGNLTSGTDLIHRTEGVSVHAIGTPLITNTDGTKFGKSEGNAVWLDPELTSPYAFYQFWLNTDDADVIDRLKVFTFLERTEIERLHELVEREPFRREAQRVLAREVTSLVHGTAATDAAIAASEALFGQGDLRSLDAATLRAAIEELPNTTASADASVVQLLVDTGLSASLSDARRAIDQGGVSLNNARIDDPGATLGNQTLPGGVAVLRRGKKTLAGVIVAGAHG